MFNPVELYSLAVYLHYNPGNLHDAGMRTCISRAYYAAFLMARDAARITNSSGSVHGEVYNYYFARQKRLARRLKDLSTMRKDADYELNATFTSLDTGKAIELAKNILNDLGYTGQTIFHPTNPTKGPAATTPGPTIH